MKNYRLAILIGVLLISNSAFVLSKGNSTQVISIVDLVNNQKQFLHEYWQVVYKPQMELPQSIIEGVEVDFCMVIIFTITPKGETDNIEIIKQHPTMWNYKKQLNKFQQTRWQASKINTNKQAVRVMKLLMFNSKSNITKLSKFCPMDEA